MVVSISGNIGSGKSTLVGALARELQLDSYPERPSANIFFASAHPAPFQAQAAFLAEAGESSRSAAAGGGVQERSPFEQVSIFGEAYARTGLLSAAELDLLRRLERLINADIRPPDCSILLDADVHVLLERIRRRAQAGEDSVPVSPPPKGPAKRLVSDLSAGKRTAVFLGQ
jgi:deoxyadenosine/deoxycytidine kinase